MHHLDPERAAYLAGQRVTMIQIAGMTLAILLPFTLLSLAILAVLAFLGGLEAAKSRPFAVTAREDLVGAGAVMAVIAALRLAVMS